MFTPQEALHRERLQELDTITVERDTARGDYESLRKKRLDEFMTGFSVITSKLKEMYQVKQWIYLSTMTGSSQVFILDVHF